MILTRKRLLLTIMVSAAAFVLMYLIVDNIGRNSFTVNTNKDAEIFVATERGGEFISIGVGSADYSTKQKETVFIQVVEGDKKTRASVIPGELNGQVLELQLKEPLADRVLFEAPIIDPLVSNEVLYGISGQTNSIITAGLERFVPQRIEYLGLPYLSQIEWVNPNNFIYTSFDNRVGLFRNGDNLGYSQFGSSPENSWLTSEGFPPAVYSVSSYEGRPTVFLTDRGVYTSLGLGIKLDEVVGLQDVDSNFYLGSDENYIYLANNPLPAAYATETENGSVPEDGVEIQTSVNFVVYDYRGNEIAKYVIPDTENITGIAAARDFGYLILRTDGLVVAGDKGDIEAMSLYSLELDELVATDEEYLVIADDGIWEYEPDTGNYYLASSLVAGSGYVDGSAELQGNKLIFSSTTSGSTHEISL